MGNASDQPRVYHLFFPTVQIHIVTLMDDSVPDRMHSEKEVLSRCCSTGNGELHKSLRVIANPALRGWKAFPFFASSDVII